MVAHKLLFNHTCFISSKVALIKQPLFLSTIILKQGFFKNSFMVKQGYKHRSYKVGLGYEKSPHLVGQGYEKIFGRTRVGLGYHLAPVFPSLWK